MYCKLQDFLSDWEGESKSTLSIFSTINEKSKAIKINDNLRSLERLAWHITQTLTEMPFRAGILAKDVLENTPIPDSFEKIAAIYKDKSNDLINALIAKWKDTDLTEMVEVYGEKWEKRKVLNVLVKHQIHHRGQMTALMRMLDLKVPGIYGPSKEEWKQYGISPQE